MKNKTYNIIVICILLVIIIVSVILINDRNKIVFNINDDTIVLIEGNASKINYLVSDADASISWTSDNPNIAIVDNTGNVIAKKTGTATITGTINNISDTCIVIVEPKNIALEDFILPDGEILLSTGDEYILPIIYVPNDGYVANINYHIKDENIIKIENDVITALSPGYTTLEITINDSISKQININVTNNQVPTNIIKPVNQVLLIEENNTIFINDTKDLSFDIEPGNGFVFDTKWQSDNPDIVSVDENGTIKGLKAGTATIELTINNYISKSITITVKSKVTSIKLEYTPKKILKVGDKLTLYPTTTPKDNIVLYESSNSNIISIDQKGSLRAISPGNATITIKNEDNSVSKKISFIVYNSKGVVNNDQTIWGFTKDTDVVPKKADANFFVNLVQSGRGTLSNNIYTYQNYSYNIKTNLLTIDNKNKIFMRIYYPENKDLSTQNTFTFIGGVGEENFSGYFGSININPSLIKSSGIIILIPESNNARVYPQNVVSATEFVKLITNQNSHARNAVGGYSNGGPPAGEAAAKGKYDKIMLINTSFYWVYTKTNIKDIEVVLYSAKGDSWIGTGSFINELYQNDFKNVTIVTNNDDFVNTFQSKYLVVNPGNAMLKGHSSKNLTLSNFFAYGCD